MSYETILAKKTQHRGYRLYIVGLPYFFTSRPDVPGAGTGEMPTQSGSVDWTRVDGAILTDPMPRTLPQKAFPLKQPEVTSTEVDLLDVDGACTDLWATERDGPLSVLTGDMGTGTGNISVRKGALLTGLRAFDSSGLIYVDNETCEYSSKNDGAETLTVSVRGKFGSEAVAHNQYHLAGNALNREVYNFAPHLHFRECVLEVFDMEDTSNNAVIARGFLQEPYHESKEEVFRIRIMNYCHALQRQVFKRTECKGVLSRDFPLFDYRRFPIAADPEQGTTQALYADAFGTPEIAAASSFFASASISSYSDDMYMPSPMMYLLVGGDDGEIVGYTNWDAEESDAAFTVALRGCFGTKVGKDGDTWPAGTPIQHLCVLAGDPSYVKIDIDYKKHLNGIVSAGVGKQQRKQYKPSDPCGVNPIEVMLMLMVSTGNGTNGSYDVLPPGYGLGIDVNRIDGDAFLDFKKEKAQGREHVYIAKEPRKLIELVHEDLQMLYGGMVYVTYDGTITIKEFRDWLPGEEVDTVALEDTPEFDNIGVQDIYNTLNVKLDQWPSERQTVENAYDFRKRDAIGETDAPGVISRSLRGPGFVASRKFGGLDVVRHQLTDFLKIVGTGIPEFQEILNALYLYLQPGQFIKVTHPSPPRLTANERGLVQQLAMILETEVHDDAAEILIRAAIRKAKKTCRWAPSAEILARTSDTVFTIKESEFSSDDRSEAYWSAGTEIYVWDAAMQAKDQVTIQSYISPTITLSGAGSSKVADDRRITWADWDTCRAGGATQLLRALTEEWYGFFGDSNHALGASDDPARKLL
jgi:hypothetical protein